MSATASHDGPWVTASDDRPPPVAEDGTPVGVESFRTWLCAELGVTQLGDALEEVVTGAEPPGRELLRELTDAVTGACHGAYIFEQIDPRASLRASDAAVRNAAEKNRKALQKVREVLVDNPVRLTLMARSLESSLRDGC